MREALLSLAREHGLSEEFPEEVVRAAERAVTSTPVQAPTLLDLTPLPFVTIDGRSTRDLDQALYVERIGDAFRVDYAIADASSFVVPGEPLFDEALLRGSSYYLPGLSIPMLPRPLSEGAISLNPKVERRALVFRMHLDADSEVTRTEVVHARILSRAKLAFEDVEDFYADERGHALAREPFADSLALLREVGQRRMRRAEELDVVRFRRTEVSIGLERGHAVVARELRLPVEQYNEQLSLLCNVEGARLLQAGDTPNDAVEPIFRVHAGPNAETLAELDALLEQLIQLHGLSAERWRRNRHERSLAQWLDELPNDGPERRVALAVHRQAMLKTGRSAFSAEPGAHFGVGADVYGRFSAPMREIVGVYLHRELRERIAGRSLDAAGVPTGLELRDAVLEAANRSKDLQKQLTREANLLVLEQVFDAVLNAPTDQRRFAGTVLGIARNKLHVLLDDPPLEVKAYHRDLAEALGQRVYAEDDGVALFREGGAPVCRLGQAVTLELVGKDARQRRFRFHLVPGKTAP
ncbi:MAG: RNB domain-containing ribonuclease [Polyangiaceae bacterium]